ncbi:hypothetical protein XFLM_11755 [Xylella fastidiosa subsp. fastidiosa GB514]|nr:hypothetical protein XFLM_11755 [Xylella fastidiosa subsp. fastidiosa GB514]
MFGVDDVRAIGPVFDLGSIEQHRHLFGVEDGHGIPLSVKVDDDVHRMDGTGQLHGDLDGRCPACLAIRGR